MVEGQQYVPVLEVGHPRVDRIDADKLGVLLELGENVHDGLGEVVVEAKSRGTARRCSGRQPRVEVARQLPLEVQGVVDGCGGNVGV